MMRNTKKSLMMTPMPNLKIGSLQNAAKNFISKYLNVGRDEQWTNFILRNEMQYKGIRYDIDIICLKEIK